MTVHRSIKQLAYCVLLTVLVLITYSCNDAPSTVGTELIPGTDTVYAITSIELPLIQNVNTSTERVPLYNSELFLYGKTTDSEGRLFIEFVNYPRLGAQDSFEVVSSELMMFPQGYQYGDTSNTTLSIRSYELKQLWLPQVTWDSIWASDGSTQYYSTSDPTVCNVEQQIATTDSVVYIPFDAAATKRWLVLGSDTDTNNQSFGLVMLAETQGSIRQFRNLASSKQQMKLRVIYKHADSTDNDTTFLESAISNFVDSPPPADSTELLVQGARLHRTSFTFRVDSLPQYAIIVGGSFSIRVNEPASTVGTYGMDELISLSYTDLSDNQYAFNTRNDGSGLFNFPNISTIIQNMRRYGGSGNILIEPHTDYKFKRMNRLSLHNMTSDPALRPKLTVVYVVPTVLQ